jgi:hypothetical protein
LNYDIAADVGDWNTFGNYLAAGKEQQERVVTANTKKRREGYNVVPFKQFNFGDVAHWQKDEAGNLRRPVRNSEWKELADVVGALNKGIKFQPQFLSQKAAKAYISRNLKKAQDKGDVPGVKYWSKWAVQAVDMDADPDTPDSVLVFSDKYLGRLKAIDGYHLTDSNEKNAIRNFYDFNPTKEQRVKVAKAERAFLKKYFKENPTPASQAKNPITEFEPKTTAFNVVRATVKKYMNEAGIIVHSRENQAGNVTAQHFMALLGKLTPKYYRGCLAAAADLPRGYDFDDDPKNVLGKAGHAFMDDWTKPNRGKQISKNVWDVLEHLGLKTLVELVGQAAAEINTKAGKQVLTVNGVKMATLGNRPYVDIVDADIVLGPNVGRIRPVPYSRADVEQRFAQYLAGAEANEGGLVREEEEAEIKLPGGSVFTTPTEFSQAALPRGPSSQFGSEAFTLGPGMTTYTVPAQLSGITSIKPNSPEEAQLKAVLEQELAKKKKK